jgi:hypothetical protein
VKISDVILDLDSRDDIPSVLRGLQHLYEDQKIRDEVLKLIDQCLPEDVSRQTGRPGMDLWTILVLGILRLALNCDYDRITELANEHRSLRHMLGHEPLDEKRYGRTTILENLSLVTPEILRKINVLIVKAGHDALGEKDSVLHGRCDSFVVETDVDYPTDGLLLLDGLGRVLDVCAKAQELGVPGVVGWRQHEYHYRELRSLYRTAQRLRPSTAKDEEKVKARQELILESYAIFLERCRILAARAEETLKILQLQERTPKIVRLQAEIEEFLAHSLRQIDQTYRRVIRGESIPHEEKVFSLFEPHTEWVSKGKAGVPVELGVRVGIIEDQFGFILDHRVMSGEIDQNVPVEMIKSAQVPFPNLRTCSFDKGFYTPANRAELSELLDLVVLPKKGKWSAADRVRESDEQFVAARRQHPAVESAINALEIHGLDRCLDHGLSGFERYVAWAIAGRNLLKLGSILLAQDRQKRWRKELARSRRAA